MFTKMKNLSIVFVLSFILPINPLIARDSLPPDDGRSDYHFCNETSDDLDLHISSGNIIITVNNCKHTKKLRDSRLIYKQIKNMCGSSSKKEGSTYVYIEDC